MSQPTDVHAARLSVHVRRCKEHEPRQAWWARYNASASRLEDLGPLLHHALATRFRSTTARSPDLEFVPLACLLSPDAGRAQVRPRLGRFTLFSLWSDFGVRAVMPELAAVCGHLSTCSGVSSLLRDLVILSVEAPGVLMQWQPGWAEASVRTAHFPSRQEMQSAFPLFQIPCAHLAYVRT